MDIIHGVTRRGNVKSLRRILADNPDFPLADPKFTSFLRTPLHVAAKLGNVEFARVIVNHDPELAAEVDSQGCTPLHLASTKNNGEMVRVLLNAKTDACLVQDIDGRTPLHLASIRDEVEVMELLIQSRPEAIHQVLPNTNETILHLCVKHDKLKAMKKLVGYLVTNKEDPNNTDAMISVNSIDNHGNTILHQAAQKKRMMILKYLLDSDGMGVEINIQNGDGFRALDMLDADESYDLEFGCDKYHNHAIRQVPQQSATSNNDRVKERLNTIMIVAALVAGIAFQALINPSGGIFQDDSKIDSVTDPVMFTYYLKNVIGTSMSKGFQSYIKKLPPQTKPRGNVTADEIISYRAYFVKDLLNAATTFNDSHTSQEPPYVSTRKGPGIVLEEDRWRSIISKYNTSYGGGSDSGFSPYLIHYAGTPIFAYRSPAAYEVYMIFNLLSLLLCVTIILVVTLDPVSYRPSTYLVRYLEIGVAIAMGFIGISYLAAMMTISHPFYRFDSISIDSIIIKLAISVGVLLLGSTIYSYALLPFFKRHILGGNPWIITINRFILLPVSIIIFVGMILALVFINEKWQPSA